MSRPLSISLRLNLLFLIILALVLVGGGGMLFVVIERHFQEQDRMEIAGNLRHYGRRSQCSYPRRSCNAAQAP